MKTTEPKGFVGSRPPPPFMKNFREADGPVNVEPHGLTAVAPLHMLRRAKPSEAYPPSPRLRRGPTSHSSTGLPPWLSAKEGKFAFPQGPLTAGLRGGYPCRHDH